MRNFKPHLNRNVSPDLILFDPPYFTKKAGDYDANSISGITCDKASRKVTVDAGWDVPFGPGQLLEFLGTIERIKV